MKEKKNERRRAAVFAGTIRNERTLSARGRLCHFWLAAKMLASAFLCVLFFSCAKNSVRLSHEDFFYPDYFRLENGLSVFVKEDHKVPLAYIEIAVRAGAITQRSDNAGIFHLYEHMMFKGNSLYPNSTAVQKAIADMGIDNWNGTTGEHCVNYFFTVPSSQLENGMRFWSAAIREPLLDEAEFEDEKKVVVSEISAKLNSPGTILGNFFRNTFFPVAPWQLDPSGSVQTVQDATLSELKRMKQNYYVPGNAALFVGGDVDAEQVKRLAQEIFGDWQNSDFDFSSECAVQDDAPFSETRFFVMSDEQISPQIARVSVYFRGADADFDRDSTYALDVFTSYINLPQSDFVEKLSSDQNLQIISSDYVGGGYSTRRRTSTVSFYAVLSDAENEIAARAKHFYSLISDDIIENYVRTKQIVPKTDFKKILQSQKDRNIISAERAENVLEEARYWWTVCDAEYYFSYDKHFRKVKNVDIARALETYVYGKNAFVCVSVNPEIYKAHKNEFVAHGFEEIRKSDF